MTKGYLKEIGLIVLGIIMGVVLTPTISYLFEEKPELQVLVDEPLQFHNATEILSMRWKESYILYTIELVPKTKSKQIEDINLVFSYDAAIINITEEYKEGITGSSVNKVTLDFGIIYKDYIEKTPIDTGQIKLLIEKMNPRSQYRFNVVVDPKHENGWISPYFFNDTYIYDGYYYFNTQGGPKKIELRGNLPYIGTKSTGVDFYYRFN